MAHSLASDSVHPGGKLPPTLTPTGHFAGKPTLQISRSVTLIGARKQARLQLISSTVSQNHALIVNADSGPYIRDLASRMGVIVNGEQQAELPLRDGDEVQIGRFTFRFNASPNAQPIEAARREPAAAGQIRVDGVDGGIPIRGKSLLIGRRDVCDIHLLEDTVSTTHAIVFEMDGRRYIRDLASRTGTFVNGKQVHQVELMPGDEIRIGETTMRYAADASPGATQDEIVPTDLGVDEHDLELEPTEDVAPVAPPPRARPERPMPPAPVDKRAIAAEALELVHDQPDEYEPVELAPVELEAPSIPPEPEVEVEVEAVDDVELEPLAPTEANRSDHDAGEVDLQPIEVGGLGGAGFEGLHEIRVPEEEAAKSRDALVPLNEVGQPAEVAPGLTPLETEIDISPEESFELEAVEAPLSLEPAPVTPVARPAVRVPEPAPVIPPAPPVQAEADELDLAPLEAEPEPEEVLPLAAEQPLAAEPAAVDEVQEEELGLALEPEPTPEIAAAPPEPVAPAAEVPAPAPVRAKPVRIPPPKKFEEPLPMAEAPAPVTPAPAAPMFAPVVPAAPTPMVPPSRPTLVKPPAAKPAAEAPAAPKPAVKPVAKPAPAPILEPVAEAPKPALKPVAPPKTPAAPKAAPVREPAQAKRPPAKPAGGVGDTMLPLDAFTAPVDEIAPLPPIDTDINEELPELTFDATEFDTLEDDIGMSPRLAEISAEAPVIDTAATGEGLDFGDVEELPDSVFAAALDDSAFAVAPLDLGEEAAAAEVSEEESEADLELGLEAPPVEEPPVEDAVAEEPAYAAEPAIEEEAEVPVEEAVEPSEEEEPAAEVPVAEEPAVEESTLEEEPVEEAVAEAPEEETETIAPVEATPESAQALDEALEEEVAEEAEPREVGHVEQVDLTDSTFGRDVSEFAGESTGPIVDEAAGFEPSPPLEPPPPHAAPSKYGPGASQLHLEPLEPAPPMPAPPSYDEVEAVEVEPEELLPVEELAPVEPPQPRERLFDLEPIEAPVPADQEAEVTLAPTDPPEVVEVAEDIQAVEAVEAVEAIEEAVEPIEVDQDALAVEIEPEPAAVDESPAAARGVSDEAMSDADIAMELGLAEAPPQEVPPAPVSRAPGHIERQELAPPTPQPVARIPEPIAPTPQPKAPVPVSEIPRVTPPPPAPHEPPAAPRSKLEEFNWGANQEHFFGGMPLKLSTPEAAQPRRTAPPAPPVRPPPAPAAAEDEPLEVEVEPEPVAEAPAPTPAPPRPAPPQQQQPPQAPRPTVRKPAPQRPMQTSTGAKSPNKPQVATGFDGLAMPPVHEADVFSQTPGSLTAGFAPGLMDDVFAGGARVGNKIPPTQPAADAGAARPRRTAKADPMGDAWAPVSPPETGPQAHLPPRPPSASGSHAPIRQSPGASGSHGGLPPVQPPPAPPPPRKKRRWFGLKVLLPLMFLFAAAAAAGVFILMPVKSAVAASLKYQNFEALPQIKRMAIQRDQMRLLESEAVRQSAVGKAVTKKVEPKFLADVVDYSRLISQSSKFDAETGLLTISYSGKKIGQVTWPAASVEDRGRIKAILDALYDANTDQLKAAGDLARTVEHLTANVAEKQKEIDAKKKQIEELASASERPDAKQLDALQAEATRLEAANTEAASAVARLTTELATLRNDPNAAIPSSTNVIPIPPPPAANDEALAGLEAELKDLNQRIADTRAAMPEKAKLAKTQLDAALETFNQTIAKAQTGNNNPELLAYLNAAQKLLASSRELTDGLIERQQKQYAEMTDLKAKLNEKMLARRAEVWKKDPELLKLMDQRDIQTRRYNAAIGQNLTKEAGDIRTDLNYIESAIKARQTIVADDGFYADAIDELQKIIDATQKGIERDRTTTLASLDEMQKTFTDTTPQTLTPEQKALAADIGQKLAAVSEARRQYTQVADAASQEADQQIRQLQISASQVASRVAARKEELGLANATPAPAPAEVPAVSNEDRNRVIDAKATELAAAQKSAADVKVAYDAAALKAKELQARIDRARTAGEQRDKLIAERDKLQQEWTTLSDSLKQKQDLARAAVVPEIPREENVTFKGEPDQRPKFALIGIGAVVGVFVFAMALSSIGARREARSDTDEYAPETYETDSENGHAHDPAHARDRGEPVEA